MKPEVLFKRVVDDLMLMLDEVFDEHLENMDKRKRSELEDDSSGKFKNITSSNVSWF
jgi:hypothetical protein